MRLRALTERFKLDLSLDTETTTNLEHYSTIRNIVVHDQGFYDISMDDSGATRVAPKKCFRHPTPVSEETLQAAQRTYVKVVGGLYVSVVRHVFKRGDSERFTKALADFRQHTDLALNTAILWASILSFLALPPWMAFM